MTAPETTSTPTPPETDREMPPGSTTARRHGCVCSVLANAAYRSRREPSPLVDPSCPLHAMP